jgi:Glycosyl transferase family, a/b domain
MAHVASVRKEIGIRTIFNVLGPLCNPAEIDARIIGVSSKALGQTFAETMQLMGVTRAMVVCGFEDLDEISPEGRTHIWRLDTESKLEYLTVEPADFGLLSHPISRVKSGTPPENAALLLKLLDGELPEDNPVQDFVLLNAAALLVCAEVAKDWKDGVKIARESIKASKSGIDILCQRYLECPTDLNEFKLLPDDYFSKIWFKTPANRTPPRISILWITFSRMTQSQYSPSERSMSKYSPYISTRAKSTPYTPAQYSVTRSRSTTNGSLETEVVSKDHTPPQFSW